MKFELQFVGENARGSAAAAAVPARSASPYWRSLKMSAIGLSFATAFFVYWHYHTQLSMARAVNLTRPSIVTASSATVSPAPAAELATGLPRALSQAAQAGAMMVGTRLVEVLSGGKSAPLVKPVEQPATAAPVAIVQETPMFKVVSGPMVQRVKRVQTAEEKLALAGRHAFDQMMGHATRYPDAYGFLPTDDFEEIKLGSAIPVYLVPKANCAAYQSNDALKSMLQPASLWVFPVTVGGRLCCMIQVSHNGRDYVPGRASKGLAETWAKITAKWPASEGYHPLLVVNPAIPGYYFTVPEADMPNLTDVNQMYYLNPNLSPADVILASWR